METSSGHDTSCVDELQSLWARFASGKEVDADKTWLLTLQFVYKSLKTIRPDDRDDIAQNALLKIMRISSEKSVTVENWPGYIYQIVRRCISDFYRKTQSGKVKIVSLTVATDENEFRGDALAELLMQDCHLDPAALLDAKLVLKKILLNEGKEKFHIFCLYLQRYKYKEIAELTGLNINTVATIIYNIKKNYLNDSVEP